jgi:hypothetical protein
MTLIERLRSKFMREYGLSALGNEAAAEIDDLMKANALWHALVGNREAEIERLRADGDVFITSNGALTSEVLALRAETERLRADKDVIRSQERIAAYERGIDMMEIGIDQRDAEIERLRAALRRIDGINDNPACYNAEINEVLDRILRPGTTDGGTGVATDEGQHDD